jgi:hypothetical protein
VIPVPLIINPRDTEGVIVNALPLGLNTMPLISTVVGMETAVVLETANVAVSASPLGTVAGIQFAAVFQSPVVGLRSQVALPPWAVCKLKETNKSRPRRPARREQESINMAPVYSDAGAKVKQNLTERSRVVSLRLLPFPCFNDSSDKFGFDDFFGEQHRV